MITEKLVDVKEVEVSTFEDAQDLLNSDFLVEQKGSDLKDIVVDESGIMFDKGSFQITDLAINSLCQILELPILFARSIPTDLFLQNVEKLKSERNRRICLLIGKDNTVINIVDVSIRPYEPAKNIELLSRLEKDVVSKKELKIRKIAISSRGMEISFLQEGQKVEPVPGDVTEFGLSITNSESGWRGAKANFSLLRLICTNGAVVSNSWGNVNWSYDHRLSFATSYTNFINQIIKMTPDLTNFKTSYKRLIDRELLVFEYVNVHRRLSRIVGNYDADRIMGIDKEDRNLFIRETREGNRLLPTATIAYDVYNNITSAAQKYSFVKRQSLEELGGALIDITAANTN